MKTDLLSAACGLGIAVVAAVLVGLVGPLLYPFRGDVADAVALPQYMLRFAVAIGLAGILGGVVGTAAVAGVLHRRSSTASRGQDADPS